jgi:hypothetical protein
MARIFSELWFLINFSYGYKGNQSNLFFSGVNMISCFEATRAIHFLYEELGREMRNSKALVHPNHAERYVVENRNADLSNATGNTAGL